MRTGAVRLLTVGARATAVVAQTTTWSEFPKLWGSLLGQVYEFVRARPELATGDGEERWQNVMLYKDQRPDVEVGVLVSTPFQAEESAFQAEGSVILSALPAGEVVTATHRGEYSKLGVTHEAVRAYAAAHGRELTGSRWEVYGHAPPDPSEAETEVFWLLR
jgi:effector-binding domain-containing protein